MTAMPPAPGQSPAADLGRELRRLRVRRGLSQRGLVRALGLSAHSNLVEYELGRRIPPGDIIGAYEDLFGVEAAGLRGLWSEALADRAGLSPPAILAAEPESPPRGTGPATLPAGVADFTGRSTQLAHLAELTAGESAGVVIAAIAGTAGVGKTALAIHFAHQISHRYPDGQLYVNLRGYALAPPRQPIEALSALLDALGVPAERIPPELDRAAALYRSALAGRRILVVLDNAYRADQVRPLLPGTSGCLVIVTSRDRLGGLIAQDGARRLSLDVLTSAEAIDLLGRILGVERVAAEPAAAADLARTCAYLPLALRIAAANLTSEPHLTIAAYADRLRADNPLGLAADADEEGAVRAAFEASYGRLSVGARRMFRRLGIAPGADITVRAAAALESVTEAEAGRALDQLAGAHLVDQAAVGRFTSHDLLRRYAAARAELDDSAEERSDALDNLFDWYLVQVDAAARLLYPGMLRLPSSTVEHDAGFADRVEALAWLDAERGNLVAAVAHAAEHGPAPLVWQLADTLRGYFGLRMPTVDWGVVGQAALDAATRADEPMAVASAHLSLSNLAMYLSRYPHAIHHASRALELARLSGWARGEAAILDNLGTIYWQAGQLPAAAGNYEQALVINQRHGWELGQANNLSNLGLVYRESGRLRTAVDYFSRALEMDRAAGNSHGQETTLSNLGEAHHVLGELDLATEHLTLALDLCRELGNRGCEANALHTLAAVDLDAGRFEEAYERAVAAVELAEDTGDPRVEADSRNVLGTVHRRQGRLAQATEQHRKALELAREGGSQTPEASALIGLAAAGTNPRTAIELASDALQVARKAGYRVLEGLALITLADLYRSLGQPEEADLCARQAEELRRETH